MDNDSISGTSGKELLTPMESGVASDVLAKLRRLKIQESIICASLQKHDFDEKSHKILTSPRDVPNWKIYSDKVRNDITEIKNIFEDIKIATSECEDNLKTVDIKEVERDVLNLNDKIKSLEHFISTELKSLRLHEEDLVKQMNDETANEVKTKDKVKLQTKHYNEVVPSPVRVLIHSPLKCIEVQQFQEFMAKSKNRHGGWNEYNHNIFVQIWNKFYASDSIVCLENNMKDISNNILLPQLKNEIIEKIPGINLDDILLHSKWYSEFCYRKLVQQLALDKWKDNRMKIKRRQAKVKNNNNISRTSVNETQNETRGYQKTQIQERLLNHECNRNQNRRNDISNTAHLFPSSELFNEIPTVLSLEGSQEQIIFPKLKSRTTFATPTEQWINRSSANGKEATRFTNRNHIESVDKLRIPKWRLSLQNE